MQVVVARIGKPHGLAGEVSVEIRTDDPQRRLTVGATLRTDPAEAGPLRITHAKEHSGRLLLRFEGVADRSRAEALRNVLLVAEVDPAERPDDPDEFYDHQLVGLGVHHIDGGEIGSIAEVLHLPGHDVLAVAREGGDEVLVPFVSEIVPTVDLDRAIVVISPPPGLLDPDQADSDEPPPGS